MRTIRLRRVVVVIAAALGLLGTSTPAAQATTVTHFTFQGNANTSGGLSYPCIGEATPNLTKCSTPTFHPTKGVIVTGGNTRGFGFSSAPCVAVGASNLLGGATTGAGLCSIAAAGVITGSCGLSTGLLTVTIKTDKTFVLVVPPGIIDLLTIWSGSIHFTGIDSLLVMTGSVNGSGTLVGVIDAIPLPDLSNPPTISNSCLTKTADDFTVDGTIAIIEP